VADTGSDIIFVKRGFLHQREIVTKVDAVIGRIFIGEEKVLIAKPQFIAINKTGQQNSIIGRRNYLLYI